MNMRAVLRGFWILATAAAVGWGGHRVFQRVEMLAGKVPRAGESKAAPPARELRRAFARLPPGRYELGEAPAGSAARAVELSGFWMGKSEVTCEAFAEFLNATRNDDFASPQFVRDGGQWQPIRPAFPVAHVDLADARGFAQWFGARWKVRARLPRADEWEAAARGGVAGAPYAWGWGAPEGRAAFAGTALARTALYPANGFGLFDCSGGVAEWCEPEADATPGEAVVCGGSWSDRDPAQLRLSRRPRLPSSYRDADVGFRILIE